MITSYKIFEDTQNQKFEIPEQIRKYYVTEGDMSNAKNWKSTKYFRPFTLRDQYKESALGIRYVLISTDTNHIIPINMNDEHHKGLDVLYDVFYEKYDVTEENYLPADSWRTSYIYNIDDEKERKDNLIVFQKFLDYGGNPKLKVHFEATVESDYKPYEMTVEQFLLTGGLYKDYMKKLVSGKEISPFGIDFIKILEELTVLWNKYVTEAEYMKKEISDKIILSVDKLFTLVFMNRNNFDLIKELDDLFLGKLSKAKSKKDIEEIGSLLFSHNGIKNFIHIKLKDPKNKEVKKIFWNVNKAKIEFDRLSRQGEIPNNSK